MQPAPVLLLALSALAQGPTPASVDATASWLDRAAEGIARSEYRFSRLGPELYGAPNRAHELRSRVSPLGIEILPRETPARGGEAEWRLRLRTRSFGRVGDALEVSGATLSVEGRRAELARGELLEWYVNDERGIEQGWTIARRPPGVGPLEIGLAIEGDLSLRIDAGARSGRFVDARGKERVRYHGLVAWDAEGLELEARIAPSPEGVAVLVHDEGATYPLTVDPLAGEPFWSAGYGNDGRLGQSVSTAGDVNGDGLSDVIVGAPLYDQGNGLALLYLGGLTPSPDWTWAPLVAGAELGSSVAAAGDVNGDGFSDVILSAPGNDMAYVFHGSAAGLGSAPDWERLKSGLGPVSCAGDVNGDGYSDVVLGTDTGGGSLTVVVYTGSPAGLAATPSWTYTDSGGFGRSVSTAGDVDGDGFDDLLIGAPSNARAYLFRGSALGLAATPDWTANDGTGSAFGISVAGAGDVNGDGYADVLVGASGQYPGRCYAYHGSPAGLPASPSWMVEPTDPPPSWSDFGFSVSTAGDVDGDGYSDVLVGYPIYGEPSDVFPFLPDQRGRADLYNGSTNGLAGTPSWIEEGPFSDMNFGLSVATAGDVNGDGYSDVVLGAPRFLSEFGRAYAYLGGAEGLVPASAETLEPDQQGALLGTSVACAGDLNGDGYSDLAVGAPQYDNGETNEGAVFVFAGSPAGPGTSPDWLLDSDDSGSFFGTSVASAGDVNGDGYADLVVGASGFDDDQSNEGRAYVFHGSPSGLSTSPAWTADGNQATAFFGNSVATAGDVNGDGFSDVIIGAYRASDDLSNEGRAFVYHGSPQGLQTTPAWIGDSDQSSAQYGFSVSTAGDVNADGYSDVVVGAWQFDDPELGEGRVYVYHGSPGGLSPLPAWTAEGDQAGAVFGCSVATAGDVNGDGYSDVIVGAYGWDGTQVDEGRAYVYHGSATGLLATPSWSDVSGTAGAQFGSSVASAGDVNADGYSDVLVGAPRYAGPEVDEGRAFAYRGSASGLAAGASWTLEGQQAGAFLGASVSAAGDLNGDGYADVAVGAYQYDGGETDEGRVFVHLGNGGTGGTVHALQQRHRTGLRPIALGGFTSANGHFRLRAEFARNPALFPLSPAPSVWLEWEVVALGVPFDGSNVVSGSVHALDPGGGDVVFDELVGATSGYPGQEPAVRLPIRWRARVATDDPLFAHTAWFTVPGRNVTETKLVRPPIDLR